MAIETRRPDRRTAEVDRAMELLARRDEARQFVAALRVVGREFVAVAIDSGPAAMQVAGRLSSMTDRYERRWQDEA